MKYVHFISAITMFFLILSNVLCKENGLRRVGTYLQDVSTFYTTEDGLPDNDVRSVAVTANDEVYSATGKGLAIFSKGKWTQVKALAGKAVRFLAAKGNMVAVFSAVEKNGKAQDIVIYLIESGDIKSTIELPKDFKIHLNTGDLCFSKKILLGTSQGLFTIDYDLNIDNDKTSPVLHGLPDKEIRQIAVSTDEKILLATDEALFGHNWGGQKWEKIYPRDDVYSWAPVDVRGVTFDRDGKFWFASPQGAGVFDSDWTLYTGHEGLPYNDFTTAASDEKGLVWFGTHKGAICFDGETWEYRQGLRWLPDDDIRDIAVTSEGHAWFATKKGIGLIERRPITLAKKAQWFEDEIDRYHRRTPYEFVLGVYLPVSGDKTKWIQHDSDNDGLWTSMYGAGECFAYAATKDPKAKARAQKAFKAMQFLRLVTEGAKHSPPPGFVARTILPTSGPDPNIGRIAGDIKRQREYDRLWKIFEPRWPKSADGKWYWKTDTSSDELDGHYFLYALYYDLVAETEEEKAAVREQVKILTDHLIDHHFNLMDHDGKPTRWARFSPEELNFDKNWFVERGLNSLSMLSYLAVAEHVTGDTKYAKIKNMLIEKNSYLQNMMNQKYQRGIGTGNQSDDEMAFMSYYNLIKYEKDPDKRASYAISFWHSWKTEQPEMNPFFNFAFAAVCSDLEFTNTWGTFSTAPTGDWLDDSIETLKRLPLNRINWRHENSHRLDIIPLHENNILYDDAELKNKGYRYNGKVIPVDECYFNHWNRDPWQLDSGGSGQELGCGTIFLLPYYMGLYHGFISE